MYIDSQDRWKQKKSGENRYMSRQMKQPDI